MNERIYGVYHVMAMKDAKKDTVTWTGPLKSTAELFVRTFPTKTRVVFQDRGPVTDAGEDD